MMILSTKLGLALATLSTLGLAAAQPAAAQSTLTAGGSVVYGSAASSLLPAAYGTDGLIEFNTTPAAQESGTFVYRAASAFTPVAGAVNYITQPSYISALTGFSVDEAAGYGYPSIAPGLQSGAVGFGAQDGSGNIFSFTVGKAQSFTFGVLANYHTNPLENPGSKIGATGLTLTGSGSSPVSVFDAGSGASYATIYLFNIANATAGETFTLSTDQGFISGATFDPSASAPVPEASTTVSFGLLLALGLGGLAAARRRKASQAAAA